MSTQITGSSSSQDSPKETGIQNETSSKPSIQTSDVYRKSPNVSKKVNITLIVFAILVNAGVLYMTYLLFSQKSAKKPEDRKIEVPFKANKELLAFWKEIPVQHDGRIKPFDSLARSTMLQIVGREKFEKNDPVAVVLSWMMMYEQKGEEISEADRAQIDNIAKEMNCDWDNYPFILCDYQELRESLYKEAGKLPEGEPQSEDEKRQRELMLHGKYIEPAILRESAKQGSGNLLDSVYTRIYVEKDFGKVKPLTQFEQKVQDVVGRLRTFDSIRSTKRVGMVKLVSEGPLWYSIYNLQGFQNPSSKDPQDGISWDAKLSKLRATNPEIYASAQEFPDESTKKVLDQWNALQQAYRSGDAEKFFAASKEFTKVSDEVSKQFDAAYIEDAALGLELTFNKVNPFRWAWIIALLASLMLGGALFVSGGSESLKKILYIGGMGTYGAALLIAVYGFYCRVSISGRPPVSDMYESIIWVAFMTAVFGLILELVYRRGVIALAGGLVSTLGFVLADQLPATFDPSIKPLNAVLRSNYWLLIHVLTIVSSYAALALAWGLGNLNIALMIFSPERKPLIKTLSTFCYRAIQIGVLLLFFGTMLGGFWAAESWGRFWGWDPKEVWALIAFLFYIIPLHARYVGWIKDFGLAACSVICFSSVVMAWYGVNFILGTGLHSYGFGSGNNMWVYWAGTINISLVIHAGMRYVSRRDTLAMD